MSHTEREFREQDGEVEGRFEIVGDRVEFLDLPSEPVKKSLSLVLNGEERIDDIWIGGTVVETKIDFEDGDVVEFSYQRDPHTLYQPDPDESQEEALDFDKFDDEILEDSRSYTYVVKEDQEGDFAAFVMEMDGISAFGDTPQEAVEQIRFVVCEVLQTERRPPDPLPFYDVPNVTDHLRESDTNTKGESRGN